MSYWNKWTPNTRDYNKPDEPLVETNTPDNLYYALSYQAPSCFYDFAAPQAVKVVGYDPDLQGPEDLLKEMMEACKDL